ncbi:MAG: DUF262 domain-containing protein [Bacteroidales bacterium]|nr:DUF262 domain-containing protein [Bacteroidales bacterium]
MKGSASHLLEFLEGSRKRFIIPVYQRNYDWKQENCKQLFDDLVQVIRENKQSHFFGSIVSYAHLRDEVVLIDGQQRITTVSLILIAMINAMKQGIMASEDSNLVDILQDTYIIDKYRKEERKVRLKPFRDDCNAFDRLIFNKEEDYVADSKVTHNYHYFYDRITNLKELTMDELYRAIDSLEIIDIVLEPEHGDDPQLIFESLNSTGLDLTEADKIRNFILMGLKPDIQEKYYDDYWNKIENCTGSELDSFVRNYLTIETGVIPNIRNVYQAFKAYAKGKDIQQLLGQMLTYATAYKKLTTFDLGDSEANEIAKRLDLLDITVAYPFLMAFMIYASDTGIYEKELVPVLSCIESFIFRRLMCDLPTNALNKIFATLHKFVVKNKKETDTYSDVMVYYLETRKLSSTFPKDEEFLNGFTTKNIYAMRGKNKTYLFERLENGSSKEKNDIVGNIAEGTLTIEHIMPQTLSPWWRQELGDKYETIHEKWLHTIANLTLTGYNSTYSNKSFPEKKTIENGFLQSGLRLNQYIAKFDKWTEEELELRKKELSEKALKIWSYPSTNFEPAKKEDDVISLSEDNGAATGRKITYFIFQGSRSNVGDWAKMMWEMASFLYIINPSLLYKEARSRKNVWFRTTPETHYQELAPGLYFCPSHSSTWNKMAILTNLFKLYQIDEDELAFGVAPVKEEDEK